MTSYPAVPSAVPTATHVVLAGHATDCKVRPVGAWLGIDSKDHASPFQPSATDVPVCVAPTAVHALALLQSTPDKTAPLSAAEASICQAVPSHRSASAVLVVDVLGYYQ